MKTVLIDDEQSSHDNLIAKLEVLHPDIQILASGYTVAEGIQLIEKHQPDLVFLDIEMSDGTGFDLVNSLSECNFLIIFVTAFNQFAQTAIRLGALDYLLKPINQQELGAAILKAEIQQFKKIQLAQLQIMQQTLARLDSKRMPERMSIATKEGVLYFDTEKVIRLEAMGNLTEFIVADAPTRLIASNSIKKYETDLKPYPDFLRIHRSFLINVLKVVRFIKGEKAYVELNDGAVVPVSVKYRAVLERRLGELLA